ncbi:MAG TPA: hypothetical protein VG892_01255, partial [Terriglobales bacterium]|nr:hypothetical protein [Terriglobales bacterium]
KLMPQSRISVRLGFGRNVHEGPALSTFHEGTEVPIFESYRTTNNSYSIGVDFRLLPRTSISYDQFVSAEKGDSSWQDQNLTYRLSNGTPVDLGLPFNTAASQPCAAPITSFATTPPTINARCNAYLSYTRFAPSRSVTPTEQLSVQSNYFRRMDVSARAAYSSGENKVQIFDERFNGFVSRTLERQFQFSGPSTAKRVSVTSDLGVTLRISSSMRLIESFRWSAYRIPGVWNSLETALYGPDLLTQPNAYDPSRCPPPFTAAGCPKHGSSTSPDVTAELFQWYLGQDSKYNQTELAYEFARRGGIRVGYRYGHRDITQRASNNTTQTFFPDAPNRGACAGRPLSGTNTCQVITTDVQADETPINEHSFLLGAWAHPMDSLRASLDVELRSADRAFTRISPRNLQQYRVRGSYKPGHWVSMAGSLNILEQRNNEPQIGNLQHNRAAGFSVALTPGSWWSLDAGYDYRNTFSQTNICFVSTPTPAGSSPCPAAVAFLQDISLYRAVTHFGHFAAMVHPVKRLTTELGYSINSVDGTSLLLNPLAPLGPLRSQYHQPWASVAVAITSQISGKAAWNYWGYNEDSAVGPTAPRDFHANISTVSLRYAF